MQGCFFLLESMFNKIWKVPENEEIPPDYNFHDIRGSFMLARTMFPAYEDTVLVIIRNCEPEKTLLNFIDVDSNGEKKEIISLGLPKLEMTNDMKIFGLKNQFVGIMTLYNEIFILEIIKRKGKLKKVIKKNFFSFRKLSHIFSPRSFGISKDSKVGVITGYSKKYSTIHTMFFTLELSIGKILTLPRNYSDYTFKTTDLWNFTVFKSKGKYYAGGYGFVPAESFYITLIEIFKREVRFCVELSKLDLKFNFSLGMQVCDEFIAFIDTDTNVLKIKYDQFGKE